MDILDRIDEVVNEDTSPNRRFYVSGFPNKKGRYRITNVTKDGDTYEIQMGRNSVWYKTTNEHKLKFINGQAMPVDIESIFNIFNSEG